jgi:hypothetical protein
VGQEPEIPMTLFADAGAVSQMAHAEPASRADVARERRRAVVARRCPGRPSAAARLRVAWGHVAARTDGRGLASLPPASRRPSGSTTKMPTYLELPTNF